MASSPFLSQPIRTTVKCRAIAGVHPARIEYFVEYGLLEPIARTGTQWLFDTACLARLRMIERLRRDLGANLAGIAVILDLLDRLTTLQREVEQWRMRS
jgi:MerR family transcriptional regulator, heat shock protein HspR